MSTISASTTSTTAFKITTDTTGALVFQTGASPTTAMTLGSDQSVTFAGTPTYSGGTANGVAYLNGSKVLTTGTALVFDGTNLGVGITPSAWGAGNKAIEFGVAGNAAFALAANQSYLISNSYYNGSVFKYGGTGYATAYQQYQGTHAWLTAGSGTAGNTVAFTQAMTLDASGSLGVGVTPSAWGSDFRAVELAGGTLWSDNTSSGGNVNLFKNTFTQNGYVYKYKNSVNAFGYTQNQNGHAWFTAPSGTAGNAISFTQAMTLDASGRLGIGTTSPDTGSGAKLTVKGIYVDEGGSDAGYGWQVVSTSSGASPLQLIAPAITFSTGANLGRSERARIDSSGNLLVGTTNADLTATAGSRMFSNGAIAGTRTGTTNADTNLIVYSTGAAANRFYVGMGGTVFATSTTISAISDIRFKENVRDLDVGLTEVMSLKPRLYDWKEGKGVNIKNARGFIAQEFEEVFPDLIDEWADPAPEGEDPYKSVRQDLIPVLVKAIQEQQAMIEQLRADVAALKGTV